MKRFLVKTDKDSGNLKAAKKRRYDEDYIKYGFITTEKDDSIPMCLVCHTTLSNESMVPNKLERHLQQKHPAICNKPKEYFVRLRENVAAQGKKLKAFTTISDKAQMASYMIAQMLVKNKKSHLDAESIISPAIAIAADMMLGPEAAEKLKKIPLSHQTISRRVIDMSADISEQIKNHFTGNSKIFEKIWALQIDESVDISSRPQLLAFVRIVRNEKIIEEFLFCDKLKETTTGKDIFDLVDCKINENGMSWSNCVSVCMDGAPSMQGNKKGFAAYVLEKNDNIKVNHCMIHREMLVSKNLPEKLKNTMNEVVKIVNYIRSSALRSRIFESLCESMESDYKCLLYHTEVRWLSKGKVLLRFITLKDEIISFFCSQQTTFEVLKSDEWWLRVVFLNDIFEKLNALNVSIQGSAENVLTISGKLNSFQQKLQLWTVKSINKQFDCFPRLDSSEKKFHILSEVTATLKNLSTAFKKYFPDIDTSKVSWVINPFVEITETNLVGIEQEQLIDLRNDITLKASFVEKELSEFWISIYNEYPELSMKAIKILLPFGSSYLCELGFSTLTTIKSKKRERMINIDQEMRVCLSKIQPRLELICSQHQAHSSH